MPILAQVLQRERLTKQQTEKRVFWSRVRSFRVRLHRSGETAAPVTSRPGYTSWLPQKFRRITTRHHGNVQEMLPDLYLTGVEWNRSSHVSKQTSRLSELPRARAADFRGRADRRDLGRSRRVLRRFSRNGRQISGLRAFRPSGRPAGRSRSILQAKWRVCRGSGPNGGAYPACVTCAFRLRRYCGCWPGGCRKGRSGPSTRTSKKKTSRSACASPQRPPWSGNCLFRTPLEVSHR